MANTIIFDTEIFANVFLFMGRVVENRNLIIIWGHEENARERLIEALNSGCTFVSFNGIKFDIPIISAFMAGHDQSTLKTISNAIIEHELQPWEVERRFKVPKLSIDHIDLIEVAPGFVGLKTYGARMHMPWLKDLPFPPDTSLVTEQLRTLAYYCVNDLATTEELYKRLSFPLSLRHQMSEEYGIDLRSKSDAQMAETVFVERISLPRGKAKIPRSIKYTPPPFIKFKAPHLQEIVERMKEHTYTFAASGHVELPDFLSDTQITLNAGTYQLGIGGIHSTHDKKVCHLATADYVITDIDAASFYPSIWVLWGEHSGEFNASLTEEYSKIYYRRLEAKASGDKDTAEGLKIPLNGSFGKLLANHSPLYSPTLGLFITLTGQLTLLMLIERLEAVGATALSANTDGIAMGFPKRVEDDVRRVVSEFETLSKFTFEYTPYRVLAMKDVNNYIAVKTDRKVKAKGIYAPLDLRKNPTAPVCSRAVCEWLSHGASFEETIRNAPFTDFISARNVSGGGIQGEEPLGKVVRWYMSSEELPPITYASNGNKVPKTEGAKACMLIKEKVSHPPDLDYNWYLKEALRIASDIGCKEYLTEEQIQLITPPKKAKKKKEEQAWNRELFS